MSRLPATTAALNKTATMDVDASVVGQLNHSSQNFLSFNSHTPPAQPSHSTTTPRVTVQRNQTDDEQSGVKHGHEAGANNSRTDDEQSEVRNGNEAVENPNGQTDDEQSGITHGHEAGANKLVSKFTVIEQRGVLLDFPHSIAHRISADFKLGAGLAKQIKEKYPSFVPTKKEYKQKYYRPNTWVMIDLFFIC